MLSITPLHRVITDPCTQNWSSAKRWYLTMVSGLLLLNACASHCHLVPCYGDTFHRSFTSSASSALVPNLMNVFSYSQEVGNLVVSLFVARYCIRPFVWGPCSEQYDRRPIFIISFFLYFVGLSNKVQSALPSQLHQCFQIGCALSSNIVSMLIFHLFGGAFTACPLVNCRFVVPENSCVPYSLTAFQCLDRQYLGC